MQPADLIARLQHPDAAIRLDMLRIVAMLEETEALEAVAQIYRHDPHPDVRQVAGWAGKILYQARQRGHSTAQAIAALNAAGPSADTEDLVLDGAMARLGGEGKAWQAQASLDQVTLAARTAGYPPVEQRSDGRYVTGRPGRQYPGRVGRAG